MASFSLFLSLCFSLLSLVFTHSSSSLVLPVTKDNATLQYLTALSYGTPFVPTKLVLDLGGPLLWVDCASSRNTPSSSSLRTIPHRSVQCLTAKSHEIETQTWLSSLENPLDQDHPCQILTENSITGKGATEGELVEDLIALSKSSVVELEPEPTKQPLLFTCSQTPLLNGLASGAKGMVGLGRSRTSFSSQFFNSISSQRKITLCLSSSSGVAQLGSTAYGSQPESEILRSLTFTPLLTNQNERYPSSQEYFINVNSIKISGKRVSFNTPSLSQDQEGHGGTQLSSVVPYTTMQSSIYANFESAFLKAALSMNMTRVDQVAPFGLCFGSQVGPNVPVIELVLQSEMVKWSIYGRNSMVRVSDDVMCLGFLDGGVDQRNPIVIGGYQLEDVLVQFDLDTSMVGFSSSLLMRQTSCSNFRFGSMPARSV